MNKKDIVELEKEIGRPITALDKRQAQTFKAVLAGQDIKTAMKKAGYSNTHISTTINGSTPHSTPLQKLKKIVDKNYAKRCKELGFVGTELVETLAGIVRNEKTRDFDKIQAIKQHWCILSASDKNSSSISPISLSAQNVLILANPVGKDEFNNEDVSSQY